MLLAVLLVVPIALVSIFLLVIFPHQVKARRSLVKTLSGVEVPSTNPKSPLSDVINVQDVDGHHMALLNQYLNVGLFQTCFLYQWWVHMFDSSIIAPFFNRADENYDRDLSKLGVLSDFFGTSVIGVAGEDWKRQHRILLKAFTPSNINRFLPLMISTMKTSVEPKIEKEMKEKGKVDFNPILQGVAIDVVIQAAFASDPQETAQLRDLFEVCREAFADPLYTIPFYRNLTFIPSVKRSMDALKEIDKLAFYLLDKRRKYLAESTKKLNASAESLSQQPIKYMIDLLIEAHDDETNSKLSTVELKDNILLFFLAGSETTAFSMLWFVHNLLTYDPKHYARLQEEIDRVIPADPTQITMQHINSLSFFNNFLTESMRMTPSVPMSPIRTVKEDTVFGNWMFKKGTEVTLNILQTHLSPLNYENPLDFNPDRWASNVEKTGQSEQSEDEGRSDKDPVQVASQAGKFATFGTGRRICLGKSFAYLEMRVVLAYLLRIYKFSIPKGEHFPKPKKIRLPTLYPAEDVNVVVERR